MRIFLLIVEAMALSSCIMEKMGELWLQTDFTWEIITEETRPIASEICQGEKSKHEIMEMVSTDLQLALVCNTFLEMDNCE